MQHWAEIGWKILENIFWDIPNYREKNMNLSTRDAWNALCGLVILLVATYLLRLILLPKKD